MVTDAEQWLVMFLYFLGSTVFLYNEADNQ